MTQRNRRRVEKLNSYSISCHRQCTCYWTYQLYHIDPIHSKSLTRPNQ